MSTASTVKMTARQFLELGEDPPGVRLELVNGEIAVGPSFTPRHSYAVLALSHILINHTESHNLGRVFGDVDTIFGEHDVRRPDLLFFREDRLHLIGEKAMHGPPDLAVETISPSSTRIDREDKYRQYQDGGVAHYWIVDPEQQTMEGHRLSGGRYEPTGQGSGDDMLRLPPFEELEIPLGKLWWRGER